MRFCFVASVALGLAVLGCSSAPEAPQAPTPTATIKPRPRPLPSQGKPGRSPAPPLPTISVPMPANTVADLRRQETPCDRHEPGWKWVGTVVEDGRCAVGPCTCTKE